MVELLLAAKLALPPQGEVDRAYRAVKGSIVDANLLMTSAQARLKRLQLAFARSKSEGLKAKAQAGFDNLSARLAAFREASDVLESRRPGVDPKAPRPSKAAAARPAEAPTPDLLAEIAELRAGYDAAASRGRWGDVRRALERWGKDALPALNAEQERVLAAGRAIAGEAKAAAKALSSKGGSEAKGLADDAAALDVELDLLRARYRLDNLYEAHPELGGA
ncbi:MAG: hypothetical protein HY553_17020 [Elusimicrobia bacterium]|nr:hypothetical protein [Elusimicrobiota bacterium]